MIRHSTYRDGKPTKSGRITGYYERGGTGLVVIILWHNWFIGLVSRVFANSPGDLGSVPGHVIPKTLKMVLDTSLLNTQQYKVHIKGKVEQFRKGVAPSPSGHSRLRSSITML